MEVGVLAVRYAKALFEFAKQEQLESDVYQVMNTLLTSFSENTTLSKTLEDPLLDLSSKRKLLTTASGFNSEEKIEDAPLFNLIEKFYNLVLDHRRENYTAAIARNYLQLYRKENNIVIAKVTTAIPLSAQIEDSIKEKVSSILKKDIILQKVVDEKVEGGFVLDVEDYRIDASVASQLSRIKRKLLDKNRRIV